MDLRRLLEAGLTGPDLTPLPTIDSLRLVESEAAHGYWSAWRDIPVNFPRKDASRVPDHWRTLSARISPLTDSPRLAVNPPNAILNYLYAILESEARLAADLKVWGPSDQPDWLTEKVYRERIQPRLAGITVPVISSALGVSEPYATLIRAGRDLPHPRRWQTLARLVGVTRAADS